ncbi:7048_t:CDS:2 [Rhizophagus irregularis]|nr:7048_t:CDS:2 [Rhizophagus irregularis]
MPRPKYKGEMEVDEDDDRHFWKQITHHLVINELAAKNVILRFIPYNSNRVPSKDEVKDFDTNNEKMKARLAKEDKTKIVEVL